MRVSDIVTNEQDRYALEQLLLTTLRDALNKASLPSINKTVKPLKKPYSTLSNVAVKPMPNPIYPNKPQDNRSW